MKLLLSAHKTPIFKEALFIVPNEAFIRVFASHSAQLKLHNSIQFSVAKRVTVFSCTNVFLVKNASENLAATLRFNFQRVMKTT